MVLVACGQPTAGPESFDIRVGADDTLLAISQAISVSDRLNWGMQTQTVSELRLHTLRTVDLDGEPFIDITVSAPIVSEGFWELALSVSGDEWDPEDAASPWTTTLTGASTARDVLVVGNVGLRLPMRLARTVEALGGIPNVAEVVAIEQQTFAVRAVDGTLWDVFTQEPLTPERVTELEAMYQEMVSENSTRETEARLRDAWGALQDVGASGNAVVQVAGGASRIAIDELTLADGNLDATKVAAVIDAAQDEVESLVRNPDERHCSFIFCNLVRTGYIPETHQAILDGEDQSPTQLGHPSGHSFAMPYCVVTGSVNSNAPLGCGPAAFVGLIQRKFVEKPFFGMNFTRPEPAYTKRSQYLGNPQMRELARRMTEPLGLHGRPLIANYMGTCWNTGGSMTIGAGFRDGATAFLQHHAGASFTVTSNISHYTGNVTSAPAKAAILIRNIGDKNNPVIAEYFRGVTQGHFSAVTKYAVYDSGANGLNVMTISDPTEWMSLSGTWGTERGVFALE